MSISKRGLLPSTGMNCCFLHDVAKIQTPKLSVLLRFSFMMYSGSSKIIFIQIFTSKGSLVLSILECLSICIAAQRAVMKVKKEAYCNFAYLNSSCIRKSITLMFMNYLRNIITLLWQNSAQQMFLFLQHGVSIQISINLGKTFLWVFLYEIFVRPESWQESLHSYILTFPRLLT